MADQVQNNQTQNQEQKPSDKELNFRNLEAKYQRQLEQERAARMEAERIAQEAQSKKQQVQDDDDNDDEPYVDKKKLNKKLASFGQTTQGEIQKAMEEAKRSAKEEVKREIWVDQNKDFTKVMEDSALLQKFYDHDPDLAETILQMPNTFERQKLVYKNIKALGIDKPAPKQSSVQDKVDANKRSPYYQPGGVGSTPYAQVGDFSPAGQKQAYEKMRELKSKYGM